MTSLTLTTSRECTGQLKALLAGEIATYTREKRYLHKDGAVVWVNITVSQLRDAEHRPECFISFIEDISERKGAEAKLHRLTENLEARVHDEVAAREAAQARAAHGERIQALGQLAGGIAHDFNNVLQAVGGAATLIERRPGDEPGVRRLARLAIEAAGRGASITRRLLAFGRRGDLRAENVDVAALLDSLHEIFAHTLGAAIEVHVEPAAGVPPLLADKGQLETALVNLATNARDAMPGGGRLILSAETEIVFSADAPGRACTGALRAARRRRHRRWHGHGHACPRRRAVLHHQGNWRRNRTWSADGQGVRSSNPAVH